MSAKKQESNVPDTNPEEQAVDDGGLAPAPVQPEDVAIYAGEHGVTILPINVDGPTPKIEPREVDLTPDPNAAPEDTLIGGEQVDILTGAIASQGVALSLNGHVYLFNAQMVSALKQAVDKGVVGLAL
jgi:hypothetical protein